MPWGSVLVSGTGNVFSGRVKNGFPNHITLKAKIPVSVKRQKLKKRLDGTRD